MKRNVQVAFLNIALVRLLFTVVAAQSTAQDPPTADSGYPVTVGVGQAVSVCKTGTIICPARSPICDDTSVASVRAGKYGLEIVGIKPGTTLCSVMSAVGVRAIYAVTVP